MCERKTRLSTPLPHPQVPAEFAQLRRVIPHMGGQPGAMGGFFSTTITDVLSTTKLNQRPLPSSMTSSASLGDTILGYSITQTVVHTHNVYNNIAPLHGFNENLGL